MISTDHGLVAREHDAVQSKRGEDAAADAAEHVPRLTGPRVPAVAVESASRVVGGRDGEHGVGVWGYAFTRGTWILSSTCLGFSDATRRKKSFILSDEPRGTDPERTTTVRARASRAKPSDLAKYSSRAMNFNGRGSSRRLRVSHG